MQVHEKESCGEKAEINQMARNPMLAHERNKQNRVDAVLHLRLDNRTEAAKNPTNHKQQNESSTES